MNHFSLSDGYILEHVVVTCQLRSGNVQEYVVVAVSPEMCAQINLYTSAASRAHSVECVLHAGFNIGRGLETFWEFRRVNRRAYFHQSVYLELTQPVTRLAVDGDRAPASRTAKKVAIYGNPV
jgi:hypothetical protein